VGEGGSTLSGGERQRISIARAILKDAPIILLDEATASVDPDNEKHIQMAISELVKDKTLVVIAHRLSTIRNADQILVLDEGRLIQNGTHAELMEQEGQYRNLWEKRITARGWKITAKAS
jgi:ATP-binding cassette subfamily B protein